MSQAIVLGFKFKIDWSNLYYLLHPSPGRPDRVSVVETFLAGLNAELMAERFLASNHLLQTVVVVVECQSAQIATVKRGPIAMTFDHLEMQMSI